MKAKEDPKKLDFIDFIKDFQIEDVELFRSYLTEIWLDLRLRSDDIELGINKNTFLKVRQIIIFSIITYLDSCLTESSLYSMRMKMLIYV